MGATTLGKPIAEPQLEVPDVILPSVVLKDTAPVLEGLKVSDTQARAGAEATGEDRLTMACSP